MRTDPPFTFPHELAGTRKINGRSYDRDGLVRRPVWSGWFLVACGIAMIVLAGCSPHPTMPSQDTQAWGSARIQEVISLPSRNVYVFTLADGTVCVLVPAGGLTCDWKRQ